MTRTPPSPPLSLASRVVARVKGCLTMGVECRVKGCRSRQGLLLASRVVARVKGCLPNARCTWVCSVWSSLVEARQRPSQRPSSFVLSFALFWPPRPLTQVHGAIATSKLKRLCPLSPVHGRPTSDLPLTEPPTFEARVQPNLCLSHLPFTHLFYGNPTLPTSNPSRFKSDAPPDECNKQRIQEVLKQTSNTP